MHWTDVRRQFVLKKVIAVNEKETKTLQKKCTLLSQLPFRAYRQNFLKRRPIPEIMASKRRRRGTRFVPGSLWDELGKIWERSRDDFRKIPRLYRVFPEILEEQKVSFC